MNASLFASAPTPDYLTADDGDWHYFVSGHDPENVLVIDEQENLLWEPLWMRPMPVSAVDPEERGDGWDSVTRDKKGRFAPSYCWIECGEKHPDARPFLGVRYKP